MTTTRLVALCLAGSLLAAPLAASDEAKPTADLYRAAAARLPRMPRDLDDRLWTDLLPDERKLAADTGLARHLEACEPALALARQAAGRPAPCRFVDLRQSLLKTSGGEPYEWDKRRLLDVLHVRLRWLAARGQVREALAERVRLHRMAMHFEQDADVCGHLFARDLNRWAFEGLDRWLAGKPDPALCAWLLEQMARTERERVELARTLGRARRFALAAGQVAIQEGIGQIQSAGERLREVGIDARQEEPRFKRVWSSVYPSAVNPLYQRLATAFRSRDRAALAGLKKGLPRELGLDREGQAAATARLRALTEKMAGLAEGSPELEAAREAYVALVLGPVARELAASLIPTLVGVHDQIAEQETTVRRAIVACALEAWKAEKGAYPAGLAALDPRQVPGRVLADPFAPGSLRYRRTERGYRLWSVGPNGQDEDGRGDDLVFERKD